MAQSLQISRISYRHESILRWLLANPQASLAQCAAEHGITQPHLSIIIHSDIFQARYREAQDGFNDEVVADVKDKLLGIAHQGLDKLSAIMPIVQDPEFVLDATERVLKTLGYGPKANAPAAGTAQVNVNVSITPNEFQAAREAAARARVIEVEENTPALPKPSST